MFPSVNHSFGINASNPTQNFTLINQIIKLVILNIIVTLTLTKFKVRIWKPLYLGRNSRGLHFFLLDFLPQFLLSRYKNKNILTFLFHHCFKAIGFCV